MNNDKTERRRRFIINVIYWAILAGFAYFGIKIADPVLIPIIIALIVAWLLRRPINWLVEKTHIKRSLIALFVVFLLYIVFGFLITILVTEGFVLLRNFFVMIPDIYNEKILPLIDELPILFERFNEMLDPQVMLILEESTSSIFQSLTGIVTDLSSTAIAWISNKAMSLPGLVFKTFITLIITVFVTMDFDKLVAFVSRQLPSKTQDAIVEIKSYAGGTLFKCLKSYLIIMSITFCELLIGLSILQVSNAPVIAAIIAVVDILPVLGTGGVVIPWAIISLITGNIPRAIGLIILYIVILIVRNIIEPKIVGSQVGLHPVITLASMFIGLHLLGIFGMFGFPIALSVVKNLNDKGIIHLYK